MTELSYIYRIFYGVITSIVQCFIWARNINKCKEKIVKKYLILFVLILIQGCGGGGGDSAPPPTAIPLDTSVIRAYQEGDTATGTMTFTDPATGNTASGDVTLVVGGIVQNPFGIDCRAYTMSGTLTGPGGTVALSVRQLLYQDNDNSIYECGEFDDTLGRYVFLTDTATTPNGIFLESKSPVQLGDTTSGVIFYDDGTWDDCTSTVQSKENVSVPLGLYESYKIYQNCSYSDGTTLVSTIWLVPSIYSLKEIAVIDGFNAEFVLKSYSYK